jgi:hypothetical protein
MVTAPIDDDVSGLDCLLFSTIKLQHYFPRHHREVVHGRRSVHAHGKIWRNVGGAEPNPLSWASRNLFGDVRERRSVAGGNRGASMYVAESATLVSERRMKTRMAVGLEDRGAVLAMGGDDNSRSCEIGSGIHCRRFLEL